MRGMVCDADGWLVGGANIFYPSWVVSNRHCLYCSEIPPAGAPPGFDCAAVLGGHVCPFSRPRRSAQDDTEGYSGRELQFISVLDRKKKAERHMGRSLQ